MNPQCCGDNALSEWSDAPGSRGERSLQNIAFDFHHSVPSCRDSPRPTGGASVRGEVRSGLEGIRGTRIVLCSRARQAPGMTVGDIASEV